MHKKAPKEKKKPQAPPKKKDNMIPKFLLKTYEMLEDGTFSEFVSWDGDGSLMVIKKAPEFAERVLPAFFKHSNLASFIRQLNMYNFKKKKSQQYDHVYGHDLFCRGKKNQLMKITRKGAENVNLARTESAPESESSKKDSPEKQDLQQEMSTMLNENSTLKKGQEETNSRFKEMEDKITELNQKNEHLLSQSKTQATHEEYLKNIISSIAAIYGSSLVENAIESVQKGSEQDSQRDLRSLFPSIEFSQKQEDIEPCNLLMNGYPMKNGMHIFSQSEAKTRTNSAYKNRFEGFSIRRFDSDQDYFDSENLDGGRIISLQSQALKDPFYLNEDCINLSSEEAGFFKPDGSDL